MIICYKMWHECDSAALQQKSCPSLCIITRPRLFRHAATSVTPAGPCLAALTDKLPPSTKSNKVQIKRSQWTVKKRLLPGMGPGSIVCMTKERQDWCAWWLPDYHNRLCNKQLPGLTMSCSLTVDPGSEEKVPAQPKIRQQRLERFTALFV